MDTIEYYNKYAAKIFEDTAELDTEELRSRFLKYLEEGDTILDLGCGSGKFIPWFYWTLCEGCLNFSPLLGQT